MVGYLGRDVCRLSISREGYFVSCCCCAGAVTMVTRRAKLGRSAMGSGLLHKHGGLGLGVRGGKFECRSYGVFFR